MQPSYDIVLLQEHKLCGATAQNLGHTIWPNAACHILEAALEYLENLDRASKGGLCTLVSPRIKHMIVNIGSLRKNMMLWVTLGGSPIGRIHIINVYAANYAKEKAGL
jgi:hypothetical protein